MFRVVDYPDENVLAFYAAGTLTKADYDWMIPIWEAKIKRWGKISMYGEVDEMDHIALLGIWEHVKFDFKHWNDFDRVAFVSRDMLLINALTAVAPKISATEMRHFPWEDRDEALHWVRHRDEATGSDGGPAPRMEVLRVA